MPSLRRANLLPGLVMLGVVALGCVGPTGPVSAAFAVEAPQSDEAPVTEPTTDAPVIDERGSVATPATTEPAVPVSDPPTPNPENDLGYLDDRVAEITATPLEARPGDTIHVTGTCTYHDNPATEAGLYFLSADRNHLAGADVPVDPATGRIDADVVVPDDATPGQNDLGWSCLLDDMVFGWDGEEIVWFTVLGPEPKPTGTPIASVSPVEPTPTTAPAPGTSDQLAETGPADHTIPLITALAAMAAGSLLLRRMTRRPRN